MTDELLNGVIELGYVRIGASNLDEWRTYLTEILGLELRDDMEDGKIWARNDIWHHRICIEQDDRDDMIGMGLRVAGRPEFQALQKKLTEAGVAFEVGDIDLAVERHVLEIMTLEDPAGVPLEIFHGPHFEPQLPFYPARRRFGKFVTGDAGLGHVIIRFNDVKETYDFYHMLGLRGASEFRIQLPGMTEMVGGPFMNCGHPGAREHTIAFGLPSEKNCNHLMIEVDNLDDLMVTYQLVKDSKYHIMLDLGRHYNDNSFSFYFTSPSGFMVEVSYDCCKISRTSYLLNDDLHGHHTNPEFDSPMGEIEDIRKEMREAALKEKK